MAKVVLIKNLAEYEPSIANIVISSMIGDKSIIRYDPTVTYKAGDKVYMIQEGSIIVKECVNNNVTGMDDSDWIVVDSGIGGSSATQNPNAHQSISYFENKLVTDIGILTARLNTISNLHGEGLSNTITYPLYEQSEVVLTKGKYEFGRLFI